MARRVTVRIKRREAMWRGLVAGHAASGMSIRAYCAKMRVKEPAFYWWRAELARREAPKPKATFVPVVVKAPAAAGTEGISIELRGGRVLRLPSSMAMGDVAALVRAIEGDVRAGAA
jgi:hypothetical protein